MRHLFKHRSPHADSHMAEVLTLIILALACFGALSLLRNEKRLEALGVLALGAVFGTVLSSSSDARLKALLNSDQAPSSPPVLPVEPTPWRDARQEGIPRAEFHEDVRSNTSVRAVKEETLPGSSALARVGPESRVREPPSNEGGLSFAGGLQSLGGDRAALEGAIAAKLAAAGYAPSAGGRIIELDGELLDIEPTLGQIPSVSLSLRWSVLQSTTRQMMARGSVQDLRGTGTSQNAARSAAIELGATRVASSVLSAEGQP